MGLERGESARPVDGTKRFMPVPRAAPRRVARALADVLLERAAKRRANRKRETKVLAAGGLIPGATNVVAALATRASRDGEKSRTALVSADGKTYSWQEYV